MRITKELVNAVLAKSGTENLGKTLEQLQSVHEKMAAIKQRWLAAEQEYVEALRELRREQEVVRKTCPHPLMTHHGDPSGGNDSCSECVVCGMVSDHDRGGYDG